MKEETNDNTLDTPVDEWRTEMERLTRGEPGSTISELVRDLKRSRYFIRKWLDELYDKRLCVRGVGLRTDSRGHQIRVPVHQLISKENK